MNIMKKSKSHINVIEMKWQIVEHILLNGPATFASLSQNIEGFSGDITYGIDELNIVFWHNMSLEGITCINQLLTNKFIDCCITNRWCYLYDGKCLNLPIKRRIKEYNRPTLVPQVFRLSGKLKLNEEEKKLFLHEIFPRMFKSRPTQDHIKQYEKTRNRIKLLLANTDKRLPPKDV